MKYEKIFTISYSLFPYPWILFKNILLFYISYVLFWDNSLNFIGAGNEIELCYSFESPEFHLDKNNNLRR